MPASMYCSPVKGELATEPVLVDKITLGSAFQLGVIGMA
jgi:hypothetical protein